jgi:N-acetylornithine carbamoyltransferase
VTKRDFLAAEDWPDDEIDGLLALAALLKRGGAPAADRLAGGIRFGSLAPPAPPRATAAKDRLAPAALAGRVMAMVFLDPSLRTRASFETAMVLHGGHAIVLEPGRGSWSLETAPGAVMDGDRVEHLVDAARVLGRYADVVGLRSFPRGGDWADVRRDAVLRDFAAHCEKPVVNLESARRHPCQQLADALTLRERLGDPRGKRFVLAWAWHPKALPTAVPASAALAAAHLGMEVVIARPGGYDLDPDDAALVEAVARRRGGSLRTVDDLDDAVTGADAIYVKSWGSLGLFGRPDEEAAFRAGLRDWRLTPRRLAASRDGRAAVLHCLPVRRNVEIDDAVLDGPSAAVVDEAENRLHVQRALLLELIGANATPRARSVPAQNRHVPEDRHVDEERIGRSGPPSTGPIEAARPTTIGSTKEPAGR